MRRNPVVLVSKDELKLWTTKRLLGRLDALRKLEESPERSDMSEAESSEWSRHGIAFKSDTRWQAAYEDLKEVLADREHV